MTNPLTQPLIDPTDVDAVTTTDAVAYASDIVRTYCGWHIAGSAEQTLTFDCKGGRWFALPALYVTDVDTITKTADDSEITDWSWSQNGLLYREGTWPAGLRVMEITFTSGLEAAPDAIQAVVLAVARRIPLVGALVASEAAGTVSRTYAGLLSGATAATVAFTASERLVLDRYRIPPRT